MTDAPTAAFHEAAFFDLLQNNWGLSPLHISNLWPWEQTLFSLNELDKTLSHHEIDWPQLRLVRDGIGISNSEYCDKTSLRPGTNHSRILLNPSAIQSLLDDGATLILDGLDRINQATRSVVMELERQLGARGSANLYLTCGDKSQGFDLHWDDHEVIVLQVSGRKKWTLIEPTRKYPLWADSVETPRPADKSVNKQVIEIGPGDCLYVPHGWWHSAESVGGHSLHLTIGLKRPNGSDFMTWISGNLLDNDLVRGPVPTSDPEFKRWAEAIRKRFEECLSCVNAERFHAEIGATENVRPAFSIAKMISGGLEEAEELWLSSSRVKAVGRGDSISLYAQSKTWDFPSELKDIILSLEEGNSTCIQDWINQGFDKQDVLEIISQLVSNGILSREKP